MRRHAVMVWVALAGAPVWAGAQAAKPAAVVHPAFPAGDGTALGEAVAAVLRDPAVSRAHWGLAVTAMDGTPLYGVNEGQYFRPASNAKLFTTAAAMALLGPNATVTTTVETNGVLGPDGVLKGDLIFRGAGDANLSGRVLPYRAPGTGGAAVKPDPLGPVDELAAQVVAKGVKRVSGDVVGDETLWPQEPYGVGWNIDDMVWGYGAPVAPLVVDDNQVGVTVTGTTVGARPVVDVSPGLFYVSRVDQQVDAVTLPAKSAAEVGVDRVELEKGTLHLTGSVAMGAPDSEEVAVLDPGTFAAAALESRLEARGVPPMGAKAITPGPPRTDFSWAESRKPIVLPEGEAAPALARQKEEATHSAGCTPTCTVLASRVSVPLAEDVAVTLKVSQNLHAEMLLRRLGAAFAGEGSFTQGTRVVRQWLLNAGLDGDDFAFADGSGLSDKDVVTPRATAQLLAFAARQPWFAAWRAGLPVGGVDGSLRGRFKDAPLKGKVWAKTGSLGETNALSGYLEAASGRTVIFSVMVDTHAPASGVDREAMDRIVEVIAANE